MKNNLLSKMLVIGLLILFVGACDVSSMIDEKTEQYDTYSGLLERCDSGDQTILFFDDFNDNIKDYDKWTEIYTDGIWEEKNQRCEFQLYEPGSGEHNEGIESAEFIAPLNPVSPLIIEWDLIVDIHSTNWAGGLRLEVTDGTNWIRANYNRYYFVTRFKDSNDESWTILKENKPWGAWDNEIQVFSDRYSVRMDTDNSGTIYDALFQPGVPLTVRMYLNSMGDQPWLYFRSGFDNVKVTFEELETKKTFIFGRIENLDTEGDITTFDAVRLRYIQFSPFSFNTYTSGEKIAVVGSGLGIITRSFAFGFFSAALL